MFIINCNGLQLDLYIYVEILCEIYYYDILVKVKYTTNESNKLYNFTFFVNLSSYKDLT